MPKKQQNLFFRLVCRYLLFAAFSPILLMNASGPAQASIISALSFTSASLTNVSSTSTRGYVFNVISPVSVAGLSVYDRDADGLAQSHDVGLWDSSGTLLALRTISSGTVDSLDPSGKFRYRLLDSILSLPIGTGYRVGAVFLDQSGDSQAFSMSGVSTATGISYVTGAFINDVTSLTFPTSSIGNGIPGGSFVLTDGIPPPLPEPGTLTLLLLGGAIGFSKRRKTSKAQ